jgi:hypothetical protein
VGVNLKTVILLAFLVVSLIAGCSSEEDVHKMGEPTSQRWTQAWDNQGYDQNAWRER